MRVFTFSGLCGAGTLLVSCLTVNINFPAAEIEKSAERIIDEVRPEGVQVEPPGGISNGPESEPSDDEKQEGGAREESGEVRRLAASSPAGVFVSLEDPSGSPPADGGPSARLGVGGDGGAGDGKDRGKDDEILDDPLVKKIVETLRKRYPHLLTFYKRGALGENRKGYVETRVLDDLDLKEKNTLRKLLAAENKDRRNLYERVATLKGVEKDRIKDIEAIYAEKWIAKARKGWWVQDKSGKWVKKEKDPDKDETASSV